MHVEPDHRNLDDDLERRLRARDAAHGRSLEDEVREILRWVIGEAGGPDDLGHAIHRRFAALGESSWSCPNASPGGDRRASTERAGRDLLDTNVVSELMRPAPDATVLARFDGRRRRRCISARSGRPSSAPASPSCPPASGVTGSLAAIDAMIAEDFAGRVLPFDSAAAKAFAPIAAARRAQGRPISQADGQIAAIARAAGAAVATRTTADFDGCGVELVDPWRPRA